MDGLEAVLADVLTAEPEESLPHADREPSKGALHLLRRRDFRLTYAAIATSELGYAFQYIALMWFALEVAGPAGVLVVRLADSIPALLFGLHGGLLADRLERRRTMIAADLFRGAVLIPVAIAGLAGNLPLWGLVLAAFLLTAATSYFDPAYGALLPALVSRAHVQEANALVRASADAINVGGWALAAGLLLFMPLSVALRHQRRHLLRLGGAHLADPPATRSECSRGNRLDAGQGGHRTPLPCCRSSRWQWPHWGLR